MGRAGGSGRDGRRAVTRSLRYPITIIPLLAACGESPDPARVDPPTPVVGRDTGKTWAPEALRDRRGIRGDFASRDSARDDLTEQEVANKGVEETLTLAKMRTDVQSHLESAEASGDPETREYYREQVVRQLTQLRATLGPDSDEYRALEARAEQLEQPVTE